MRLVFILLIVVFFNCVKVFCNETPEESLENMLKVAPSFATKELYGAMEYTMKNPTNNLRRVAGSPFFAKGIPLYIEGKVYDISGRPMKGVVVQITQANHYGVYNFLVERGSAVYDPNFYPGGVSITNNLGEYSFLTIMPGKYGSRAPHIHFNVKHKNFEIETEMFFSNHPLNEYDTKYKKLKTWEQKATTANTYYINQEKLDEGLQATFDIYINYNFVKNFD